MSSDGSLALDYGSGQENKQMGSRNMEVKQDLMMD